MADEIKSAPPSFMPGWPFPIHHPKLKRFADMATITVAAWSMAKRAHKRYEGGHIYRLSVLDTDDIYQRIHEWLIAQVPRESMKSLTVRSRRYIHKPRPNDDEMVLADGGPAAARQKYVYEDEPVPLDLFYDGKVAITATIGGYAIEVIMERDDSPAASDSSWGYKVRPDRIVFLAKGIAARNAVEQWLGDLVERVTPEKPVQRLYIGRRWGEWNRGGILPDRPLHTVILPPQVMDGAIEALGAFLDDEDRHIHLGIPWHFGMLFHGEPGTGKTSLARALAQRFGLDVYYLPLSDIESDQALMTLLSSVPGRSMLLIEDIDVTHAATERSDERYRVSMSGLLNSLDGVVTPEGLVTVMTTNHHESLDAAISRPGRVDYCAEIPRLGVDELRRLAAHLLDGTDYDISGLVLPPRMADVDGEVVDVGWTAADVIGLCKPYLRSPDKMAEALYETFGTSR